MNLQGKTLHGGAFLLCGLVLGLGPNLWIQASFLLIGWLFALIKSPRLSLLALVFLSMFPLACSPSEWNQLGMSLFPYYDLIQCSPIYSLIRLFIDPWTLPWIYEDSPFHFLGESSRPMCAPLLFILAGLSIYLPGNQVQRANH